MKKSNSISLLLSLLLLSWINSSCISDNLDDCPPTTTHTRIYFSFENLALSDIDPTNVTDLYLYAFDKDGKFVAEYQDNSPNMGDVNYYMSIPLISGEYQFISWANINGTYDYGSYPQPLVANQTNLSDALVQLHRPANDSLTKIVNHLFQGSLGTVKLEPTGVHEFQVPMLQNTYDITLSTKGLEASTDAYRVVISDDNDNYHFDNTFAPSQELHYTQLCTIDALGQAQANLRTLRLGKNSQTVLKFYNETTGTLLFQERLITLINTANSSGANIDFNLVHHFAIELTFDWTNMEISVTINGWDATKEGHDMGAQG